MKVQTMSLGCVLHMIVLREATSFPGMMESWVRYAFSAFACSSRHQLERLWQHVDEAKCV